jgi:hypothetical protein
MLDEGVLGQWQEVETEPNSLSTDMPRLASRVQLKCVACALSNFLFFFKKKSNH